MFRLELQRTYIIMTVRKIQQSKVEQNRNLFINICLFQYLGRFCVLQPDLIEQKERNFNFTPNAFQTLKVLLQWSRYKD